MRSQAYNVYRLATAVVSPLLPLWLQYRTRLGKEDAKRIGERFGYASTARPKGKLLWFHAASVGEATSILLMVQKMRERFADLSILVTTGTVTSAQLLKTRLPKEIIHQYAPLDTPKATRRFINHWRPNFSFWVESEFWPNLISETNLCESFMGIINGRMSKRSFASWRRAPQFAKEMLGTFDITFAQSDEDAVRLGQLGAREVMCLGNLKFDASLLPCNEAKLLRLQTELAGRPVWLAASTHPGEEEMIARADSLLRARRPDLLTIIVPRHPSRGGDIAALLPNAVQRSKNISITAKTHFYIADTLGELGLFYRLSEIVFMGGSLVNHGGQNPLEPARLSCALTVGPHTHNFSDIYHDMEKLGLCLRASSPENLAAHVDRLMNNAAARYDMTKKLKQWVDSKSGAGEKILSLLAPLLGRKE